MKSTGPTRRMYQSRCVDTLKQGQWVQARTGNGGKKEHLSYTVAESSEAGGMRHMMAT